MEVAAGVKFDAYAVAVLDDAGVVHPNFVMRDYVHVTGVPIVVLPTVKVDCDRGCRVRLDGPFAAVGDVDNPPPRPFVCRPRFPAVRQDGCVVAAIVRAGDARNGCRRPERGRCAVQVEVSQLAFVAVGCTHILIVRPALLLEKGDSRCRQTGGAAVAARFNGKGRVVGRGARDAEILVGGEKVDVGVSVGHGTRTLGES